MSGPVFINLEAKWLWELGATFLADEDFETGMKLQQAATHLESLDEKYRNVTASGLTDYERGKRDILQELFDRSNLPESERTMPRQAMKYNIGPQVEVKKYPAGMTSAQLEEKKRTEKSKSERSKGLESLGLKLNLSVLATRLPSEEN